MLIHKDGIVADYREVFKNTSFTDAGPTDEFLAENNAHKVNLFLPHDSRTEKLVPTEPYIQDGWAYTIKVEPKTQEELDTDTSVQASKVRAERNKSLSECDWTQLADAPVDATLWADYRQALRDITDQPGFPWEVTWPAKPQM